MTNIAKALYQFWNGFGIPAFVENTVPENMPDGTPVEMPYITYRLAEPDWSDTIQLYARVWYRGTSFTGILTKVDQISRAIGTGKTISFDNGFLALFKDSMFAQYMKDDIDETIKIAYLSIIAHSVEV